MQYKIQRYQDSILHQLENNGYITNEDELNQSINEDVPEPYENVYAPYGDIKHDDIDYTPLDIYE